MRSTASLWRALEAMPVLSGVREAWRRAAGADYAAIERLLRPTNRLAGNYPCPDAADEGCARSVIVHGDDDIAAICCRGSGGCETVALVRVDVVVHRLDLALLARAVGAALGLEIEQPTATHELARTVHAGNCRHAAGVALPAYVTLASDRSAVAEVIERLVARTGGRLLVLRANSDGVAPDVAESLRVRGGAVLALADLVAIDDHGVLVAAPVAPGLLQDAFGGTSAADTPPAAVFRKQGITWHVEFEGRTCSVGQSIGMEYIAELLRNPHRDIHSAKLRDGVAHEESRVRGSAGDALDSEALQGYRNRLADIDGELADAEERADVVGQERLQREREKLLGEVRRATGLGGRPRHVADDVERARQAVSTAIHRAKKAIKREHSPLFNHLDGTLTIGLVLAYRPDREIAWIT
ncbi:MAG: hypothetical protein K8T90_07900 [Planctomycetes bacterium]|nr:hypothetical protein [Planctomycetota bacterium]